jgi:phage tail protein X
MYALSHAQLDYMQIRVLEYDNVNCLARMVYMRNLNLKDVFLHANQDILEET